VPPIENIIIEEVVSVLSMWEDLYGARGAGELAGLGIVASIANAIYNATGSR